MEAVEFQYPWAMLLLVAIPIAFYLKRRYVTATSFSNVDLLGRDRAEQVSVYPFLSRQAGFAREAGMSFDYAEPVESFLIEDLNADGVSDLVMKAKDKGAFRIFVSRGASR